MFMKKLNETEEEERFSEMYLEPFSNIYDEAF